ncbi:MAG TPA: monovalent cation/H+ antiporter complex subunit F [Mycobacteriales bacterium]|nr:monovalent cation/H+ antiporter complex subunit F [Mycobacteriales bacterium]
MNVVAVVCYAGLAVAAVAALIRLCIGPSVPDRIVALDSLLYIVVIGIAVAATITESGAFLGVLVAVALLAFVGTATVARFVERRGGS